ncbi:MAG: phosphonate metabolism protein/1,5-bisphosphokinase (PRPP-forming) PhnN [Alphaproteobacteria bacterium]|nr:phosphonate metabolism protein/1,5-bisphosphokinase (PRPP-forming) PhnN [Alphaproteobacteria bacterium]
MSGCLVLVVGASGVGKDSLIAGARVAMAGDPRFVFPRRAITRAAAAGGEGHDPVTLSEFERRRADGAFALHWQAYGAAYGIGREIADDLVLGRHVVANVSRTVTAPARARFPRSLVVLVTAAPEIVAARLNARGREDATGIADRLARAQAVAVAGDDRFEIANDGPLAEGIARLVARLRLLDPG